MFHGKKDLNSFEYCAKSVPTYFSLLQSEGVANEEYKSSLERDNVELRSTVARQSHRVGQLEKKSPQEDDTARLQEIIRLQHEKIQYYQQEIEHSKQDMVRLEGLLQRVQEESVRRELYHAPSVGCIPQFNNLTQVVPQ
jgi:chromosome segregation ATPase